MLGRMSGTAPTTAKWEIAVLFAVGIVGLRNLFWPDGSLLSMSLTVFSCILVFVLGVSRLWKWLKAGLFGYLAGSNLTACEPRTTKSALRDKTDT